MLPKKGFSAQYNYKYKFKFKLIKNISTIIITVNTSKIF